LLDPIRVRRSALRTNAGPVLITLPA
jgi:hypothetical protein